MAKEIPIIFTLLCFSTLIANSKSVSQETKTINPKPIRIYVFESKTGPNANFYEVARSNISTISTSFGIVYVGDADIRAGPDPNSLLLGRAQSIIIITSLNEAEPAQVANYNFVFTAGKYRGSSLQVAGQRKIFVPNQEIPITGGTGFSKGREDTPFPALCLIVRSEILLLSYLIYLWLKSVSNLAEELSK